MNKCPSCNETPISLWGWCNGVNSIQCKCKSCGLELSANMATWVVITVIALVMCLAVYLSITQFGVDLRRDRLLLIGIVCVPALIGTVIGYFFSGYTKKK